jgi:hypothetical protein
MDQLRLLLKFTRQLAGHEPTKVGLRVAGSARGTWPIQLYVDLADDMYLGRGWGGFAHAHDLQLGYILIFKFNGVDEFVAKVYDGYNCRKTYHIDSDDEFDDSDEENK